MNTGYVKSSPRRFWKMGTKLKEFHTAWLKHHHPKESNHHASFLIRDQVCREEAPPVLGRIAQGHGKNKYTLHSMGLILWLLFFSSNCIKFSLNLTHWPFHVWDLGCISIHSFIVYVYLPRTFYEVHYISNSWSSNCFSHISENKVCGSPVYHV